MYKKLSDLDDSYWQHDDSNSEENHKLFLDKHREFAEYEVCGLRYNCPPEVYHPNEFSSTRFALRGLFSDTSRWGMDVLEIGTGCGAIGLSIAQTGRNVTLLDINPIAVECARSNAALNKISAQVFQSDLFEAVKGQRYDLIIFNIPLLDKPIEEPIEVMACDKGGELFLRFMEESRHHLKPGGWVYISISNIGNREAMRKGLSLYEDIIVYAEYYGNTNGWRWLIAAQPLK